MEKDVVLEIGFGTGRGLVFLGSSGRSGHIFGVDISKGMCRQARKRMQKAGFFGLDWSVEWKEFIWR
jgi:ubiquinone/menaquinone biosynthesis C-methylase UbiE